MVPHRLYERVYHSFVVSARTRPEGPARRISLESRLSRSYLLCKAYKFGPKTAKIWTSPRSPVSQPERQGSKFHLQKKHEFIALHACCRTFELIISESTRALIAIGICIDESYIDMLLLHIRCLRFGMSSNRHRVFRGSEI